MTPRPVAGALVDADILSAWTEGRERSNPDRVMALLARALPEVPAADVDVAPVGVRDGWLLDLREATFGTKIDAVTACPRCGERIEATLLVDDIRTRSAPDRDVAAELLAEGRRLAVRLPTNADLRAAAACSTEEEARRTLVERCVVPVGPPGHTETKEGIPESALAEAASWISSRDPQADVRLSLTCPECSHAFDAEYDVAAFVWEEVGARARRLVGEIHVLARAYGWTESEVMALPPSRRRAYLDLVLG